MREFNHDETRKIGQSVRLSPVLRIRSLQLWSDVGWKAMADKRDLQFTLPNDSWEAETAPEGQLFLALRKGEFEFFTPNLGADAAPLQAGDTLEDAAAELLDRLRRFDEGAKVVNRSVNHDDDAVTIVQHVEFDTDVNEDTTIRLAQIQFLVEVADQDSDRRAALCLMLTAEADSIGEYAQDFEAFLRSAEPA
jgi:hypothetical protein